jgi:predicted ester cyclase
LKSAIILAGALLMDASASAQPATPREVVSGFLETVRSGRDPAAAPRFMASLVRAHQLTSEAETVIERTPAEYADHVRDFLKAFGPFQFRVTELLADGDKVYARWRQEGDHLESIAGEVPTGKPLIEVSSAVYRVAGGKIVEYWIQLDRKGLELQLSRLKK